MALKHNFEKTEQNFDGVLVAKDAYWRVEQVSGNKLQCSIIAVAYTQENGVALGSKNYQFAPEMDGANFIKQAYLHLKTLPEFSGAVDC